MIIVNRCDDIALPPALLIVIPLRRAYDRYYAGIERIVHFWRLNNAFTLWFKLLIELHWALI